MLVSFETEFDENELLRLCEAISELICIELRRHPATDNSLPPILQMLSETAADYEGNDTLKAYHGDTMSMKNIWGVFSKNISVVRFPNTV